LLGCFIFLTFQNWYIRRKLEYCYYYYANNYRRPWGLCFFRFFHDIFLSCGRPRVWLNVNSRSHLHYRALSGKVRLRTSSAAAACPGSNGVRWSRCWASIRHRWRWVFFKHIPFILPNYSAITIMDIARKSGQDSQKRQSKIAEEKYNKAQGYHSLIEEIPKNPSTERPTHESDQSPRP